MTANWEGNLLFKITVDGHEYKIFADGRVRGFEGEEIRIENNHYHLVCEALARRARMKKGNAK